MGERSIGSCQVRQNAEPSEPPESIEGRLLNGYVRQFASSQQLRVELSYRQPALLSPLRAVTIRGDDTSMQRIHVKRGCRVGRSVDHHTTSSRGF
eukprot:82792-Prorocentrum_minimum.AAC.1